MQRSQATVEEQLFLKAVKEECAWENLPKRLQTSIHTKEEWHRKILEHCVKKRLQWSSSFVRKISKESDYYEEMMRYLRRNLALFPYHLAEYICRVMRVSPFRYYRDMIFEVMKNEQPYDSIPNFSAADALRLTGIGRNEFIDIMNKCRSKKIMWKLNKSIAKESLPTQPVDFTVEPWWGVCLVNFTLEEFKKLSEEEVATIDKVCKEEANIFILFDPEVVKTLYRRELIYFDVPVQPDDRFKVSRLEGFVSNREQSYEDPIEELLYAVFVVSSENATVAELAATLQADLKQLQAAASFACRLGWADKVIDPAAVLRDLTGVPSSPPDYIDPSGSSYDGYPTHIFADGDSQPGDLTGTDHHRPACSHSRVAFIVDANITSYLMMGSVSPGLKSHAVTLYEAGKLGHASIADLIHDLGTLEGAKFEGELQEFANHAFSLRCVLECLQSGGVDTLSKTDEVCIKKSWLASSNDETTSLIAEVSLTAKFHESGANEVVVNRDEYTNSSTEPVTGSSGEKKLSGIVSVDVDSFNELSYSDPKSKNDENLIPTEGSDTGEVTRRKRKKYRVDILRCESLASLAPATLDQVFTRDYDIVVSIVPLPHSSVLPGPTGPIHFGPPSRSSMTPWMKLVLYLTVGSGPLSVVLMKGQCLRLLPAPLAGCEKALLWSWDESTVGGLGSKFEGNLVKGSILLHCLNSLLKHSAVLVLPLSRYDLDESGRAITMDIPLPLKNSDGSVGLIGKELGLCEEESSKLNSLLTKVSDMIELCTVGYIRVLKLFTKESEHFIPENERCEWVPLGVEFGIPLFRPKLCNSICKRVVASQLLQTDTLSEHHESMQILRKRLIDICAEYQATGPAARLLYHKEQSKESSRLSINYASGRWNPLVDPCSPIAGASSENQRSKLACRNRFLTEVLSFDGNVLRSYAMTPVYEAPMRPVEESPMSAVKPEPDDYDSRDSKEVPLPGVNLIFDGAELHPFDIGACMQARQPVFLIAEAGAASASLATKF